MKDRTVIDFQVIGTCNLDCGFCCGAEKALPGPTLSEYKQGIDKLMYAGCDTVVITGGEPMLRQDIGEITRYPTEKGMQVYLSSNGLLFDKRYSTVRDNIVCLGLPLDGSTTEMNNTMTRGPRLYSAIDAILRTFKEKRPKHAVKIGTVVSGINKDDIVNIGEYLFQNEFPVDVWRLYQFSALREGERNKDIFTIGDEEFKEVCDAAIARFPGKNISPLSDADSDDAYIFISPRMDLEVLTQGIYRIIGNLRDIDVDELNAILNDHGHVLQRGGENRRWLPTR